MKKDYIEYALKLDKIGDLIISVSNLIPVLNPNKNYTLSELATYKEQLTVASERYRFIVQEISNFDVPEVVANEHQCLIEGISSFVRGTALMKDSINIEDGKLLVQQLLQGDAIRAIGVKEVERSTKEIGDKLVLQ